MLVEFHFLFLAADFCPKNLAFARKIMALPESGGCSSPVARMPMFDATSLALSFISAKF